MIFLFLIAAVLLLDLGLKDTIDEMDQMQFPKELEGSRGWILLYRNHNEGFPFGAKRKKGAGENDPAGSGVCSSRYFMLDSS